MKATERWNPFHLLYILLYLQMIHILNYVKTYQYFLDSLENIVDSR